MISDDVNLWPIAIAALVGAALGTPLTIGAQRLLRSGALLGWKTRLAASLTCGILFGLMAWRFQMPLELAAYLLLAAAAVMLSIVEFVERRLPNIVVFPLAGLVTVLLLLASWTRGSLGDAIGVIAGAAGMFAVYFVLALISPRGMGMGDVKLSLALGAAAGYLGLTAWLVALMGAFLIGAIVSIIGLISRKVRLSTLIPFGPSMFVGTLLVPLIY